MSWVNGENSVSASWPSSDPPSLPVFETLLNLCRPRHLYMSLVSRNAPAMRASTVPQAYAAHLAHPALRSPSSLHWQSCPTWHPESRPLSVKGKLVEPRGFDYLCANICHLLRVELPGIETALSDAAADRRAIADSSNWTVFDNPVPRMRNIWEDTLARLEGRITEPYQYEPGWHEDWMCLINQHGRATSKRPVVKCEFKKVQARPLYAKSRGCPDSGYASLDLSECPALPKSPPRGYVVVGRAVAERRPRSNSVCTCILFLVSILACTDTTLRRQVSSQRLPWVTRSVRFST